jgi:hypothetical protein
MTAEKAPREDMMDDIDRRRALGLFGLAIGADGILGSAVAQEVAQADTKAVNSPAITSAANIEPASHVSGDYQAVYQEGYAQAFLALGFSEQFLPQMFSEATDSSGQSQAKPSGKSRLAPHQNPSKSLELKSQTGRLASCSQIGL